MSNSRPAYFRIQAAEARHGGSHTYAHAGFHLGIHIENEADEGEIAALVRTMEKPTVTERPIEERVDRLWKWFSTTLPRCRALVPVRRRHAFVRGLATGIVESGAYQALPIAMLMDAGR